MAFVLNSHRLSLPTFIDQCKSSFRCSNFQGSCKVGMLFFIKVIILAHVHAKLFWKVQQLILFQALLPNIIHDIILHIIKLDEYALWSPNFQIVLHQLKAEIMVQLTIHSGLCSAAFSIGSELLVASPQWRFDPQSYDLYGSS
jgi:hypothetical protein